MDSFFPQLVLVFIASVFTACSSVESTDLTQAALIPYPASVEANGKHFEIDAKTVIQMEEGESGVKSIAHYLQKSIQQVMGLNLKIETGTSAKNAIILSLADILPENDETTAGYELQINRKAIRISAKRPAGLFYGVQTLRQIIPAIKEGQDWIIAGGAIQDYPVYAYRGVMLDVARHFFAVEDVKRLIDLIAIYKINYLHLHLADDQGWRIEIKKWPLLTQKGGSTEVGGGPGGFYTQEEYQEIVAYAQEHFITIVPEIDMPGHTNAALASYPVLNCNNISPDLYTGTEVGFSTLCTSKEIVYEFVDDVIEEIAAITPGPYFHVGGDESHVTELEDYISFIERVQGIVSKHDKQLMGWDEVSHAQLANNAVVQYWADAENVLRGVVQGTKVLLSPAHKVYLDMQYDSTTQLGLHWAAYIEVDSAYLWSPESLVPGLNKENILGIESPLWTETVTNIDELEYMVFPRLVAHAELGWSLAQLRNWEHFRQRLSVQGQRLEALEVDFYRSPLIDWEGAEEKNTIIKDQ